jgi:hypothetical protein
MTSYDDDASDVRAALGTLLSDEPAPGWTVQDDVARGRAYQRQRRTRWGAGIGIVAAAALVLGLVGPLRPSAPEIPVLGEAPTVEGVPQAWFDNIGPALIDQNVLGVPDWDRSSVSGSAAAGFRADLVLVPVAVTMSGEQRTVELVPGDGLTGRLTLEWFPGRTEPGPALQRCTEDVCPNQGATSFIGGPVDQAATAGKGAPFPEGTVIVDRQYPQGLLEMVNYASAPPSPAGDWTVMAGGLSGSQFLSELGNPVLGPPAPPPGPEYLEAQRAIVEPYLAQRGYRITEALMPEGMSVDGRVRVEYTVTPTDGDGALTASLFVTAYPSTIVADPYPSGTYLSYCTKDVCTDVAVTERDCTDPATCPTTFAATTTSKDYVIGSGLQIALLRYDDGSWMEVVSGPLECLLACDPITVEPDAFLTRDQTVGLASALGRPEFATSPSPRPTPTTSASPTAAGDCSGDEVKLIAEPGSGDASAADVVLRVRVIPRNEGVSCTLRGIPDVEPRSVDGPLGYVVVPGTPSDDVVLRGGAESAFSVRLQLCAPVGGELSLLRVTMPGGGEPLDVQVGQFMPLVSCAIRSGVSTDLIVSGFAAAAAPAPTDGGQEQSVAAYLAGLGIQASGGPDYAGKGQQGPGGRYAGQYDLTEDGRTSYVTVVLELRQAGPGDLLDCTDSDLCSEYRVTDSGTDSGGASYRESQILLTGADSPYGPARSRVLERQYDEVVLRLIVAPLAGQPSPLLSARQMTALADAVAADARTAVGVPAAASNG